MSSIKTSLKEHAYSALEFCHLIDAEVRSLKLLNEQWFLDWLDELNKISVK